MNHATIVLTWLCFLSAFLCRQKSLAQLSFLQRNEIRQMEKNIFENYDETINKFEQPEQQDGLKNSYKNLFDKWQQVNVPENYNNELPSGAIFSITARKYFNNVIELEHFQSLDISNKKRPNYYYPVLLEEEVLPELAQSRFLKNKGEFKEKFIGQYAVIPTIFVQEVNGIRAYDKNPVNREDVFVIYWAFPLKYKKKSIKEIKESAKIIGIGTYGDFLKVEKNYLDKLDDLEIKEAKDSVRTLLERYFNSLQSLPGFPDKKESIIEAFFHSPGVQVYSDIPPTNTRLNVGEYLYNLALINKDEITQGFEIEELNILPPNKNVFAIVARVNKKNWFSDSVSCFGSLNISIQFQRDTKGKLGKFKIDGIVNGKSRFPDILILPEPSEVDSVELKNDDRPDEEIAKVLYQDSAEIKVRKFLWFLQEHISRKNGLSSEELDQVLELFYPGSSIFVSSYTKSDTITPFYVREYFNRIKGLYPVTFLQPHLKPPSLPSENIFYYEKNDYWAAKMYFVQSFDGIGKSFSYCDYTEKYIRIIIKKENGVFKTYLGNIVPVSNGTFEKDCEEKKVIKP
ncbi:MAG: hypothetical protein J5I98_16835 [Phaeodactylibacter sp.]|nr:hypothetical protein [Phaeodactylibacter sp.]